MTRVLFEELVGCSGAALYLLRKIGIRIPKSGTGSRDHSRSVSNFSEVPDRCSSSASWASLASSPCELWNAWLQRRSASSSSRMKAAKSSCSPSGSSEAFSNAFSKSRVMTTSRCVRVSLFLDGEPCQTVSEYFSARHNDQVQGRGAETPFGSHLKRKQRISHRSLHSSAWPLPTSNVESARLTSTEAGTGPSSPAAAVMLAYSSRRSRIFSSTSSREVSARRSRRFFV